MKLLQTLAVYSALSLSPLFVFAQSAVGSLEVDGSVVTFSLSEPKTSQLPSCVVSENAQLWSISLEAESGRAMYSLILTAMAKSESMSLVVESAGDCGITAGIEQAKSINIALNPAASAANSVGRLGVYKADGVTRLGTYVGLDQSSYMAYIDPIHPYGYKLANVNVLSGGNFYFTEDACTGVAYHSARTANHSGTHFVRHETVDNGRLFQTEVSTTVSVRSRLLISLGQCQPYLTTTSNAYILIPSESQVCGDNLCIIKEE